MKQLIVQNQVRLNPGRILGLTISGISVRLFRSMVTVIILMLAVTFLSHALVHSLVSHEARYFAYQELADYRVPSRWATRLTSPDNRATVRQNLADRVDPFFTEYQRWSGASDAQMQAASADAARLLEYEAYFQSFSEAKALILLEGRAPIVALQAMTEAEARDRFADNLQRLNVPEPPGGMASLRQYTASALPQLIDLVGRIRTGHRQAIDRVAEARGELSPMHWFAQEDAPVESVLSGAGFVLDADTVERLHQAGNIFLAQDATKSALNNPAISRALIRELGVEVTDLHQDRLMHWLTGESRARWMTERIEENLGDAEQGVAPEPRTLATAAAQYRRQARLQAAVGSVEMQARDGLFDLPINTQWLITLSFLVCAVGVTNAMFMSVTDRFTEIATMKCLGALDGFLMQMFLFESLMQGLVGATAGVILGLALAVVRGMLTYGDIAWASMPWPDVILGGVLSFIVGLILSVIAGVGPALAVARLAPMEAMRIE